MEFKKKLGKIGNSKYVIIPNHIVETLQLGMETAYTFEIKTEAKENVPEMQ